MVRASDNHWAAYVSAFDQQCGPTGDLGNPLPGAAGIQRGGQTRGRNRGARKKRGAASGASFVSEVTRGGYLRAQSPVAPLAVEHLWPLGLPSLQMSETSSSFALQPTLSPLPCTIR
jgi:hypothetical protein